MSTQELQQQATIIESLVINGDLSKLSSQQKIIYYKQVCERVGVDPMAQPFKLIRMNGKEVLYLDRSGAQQLNKLHNVSHEIKARETVNGCYVVTAQAYTPDNRRTESIGAVPIENIKGDALCNAMMKAETKAKRRATLDLLGLGMLDETETETIPNAETIDIPHEIEEIDIEMWKDQLLQVNDEKSFRSLFKSNKQIIESHEELFAIFSTKATELGLTKPRTHATAA